MIDTAWRFAFDSPPATCVPFGNGHINETYLVTAESGRQYILQNINKGVFKSPPAVINNIVLVTEHLQRKASDPRQVLALIPSTDGVAFYMDADGKYWRAYDYVRDSLCLDAPETPADFRESAVAFGGFARLMSDFDASRLTETIAHFHDTPYRYAAFLQALKDDPFGRAREVGPEIEFVHRNEAFTHTLMDLLDGGELPLRVTHNDTKLNNVLFDRATRRALCVIDLDTVMPGLAVSDFGDSIRFGASTGAEDERDLSKVTLSLELFEAYTDGYLSAAGQGLTAQETELLATGARMLTLECGIRFLTDHLLGDTYFRIHREGHNLDRCRTQFRLVEDMDRKWREMNAIVERCARAGVRA